jgi:tetratricopeptide (TPR) repeat protein
MSSPQSPTGTVSFMRASSHFGTGEAGVAVRLAAEMARRWRTGERPLAEEFLARHPALWQQPESAVDLVYEEICLRQEAGEEAAEERVLARFPQWRKQLELLLECHRLLDPKRTAARFPEVGEALGDCRLLAELGRGAQGRVFLAVQPALGNRHVVLKLTPCHGREHLTLARLQHTNIVPLYAAWDDAGRNLRVLCMPYLGGTTLARLLERLGDRPPAERTGADLLRALDEEPGPTPPALPGHSPARYFYARQSYVQAVCGVAAALADGLQHAHERGLVHLDVKPSNVLLAADGTPMLLDFHLAHAPVRPDGPPPERLGGTPVYMAPEQREALHALTEGRPIPTAVDAAADVYALGLLVYEALGGVVPLPPEPPPLDGLHRAVGPGLADLVARCLADDPRRRYRSAAELAGDLRRDAQDRPLLHVHNRAGERWAKWRRRQPDRLRWALATGAACLLLVAAVAVAVISRGERQEEANAGQHLQAVATHVRAVHDLHLLANHLRFGSTDPQLAAASEAVEDDCRSVWDRRGAILEGLDTEPPAERDAIRTDLLDLALIWADLRVRGAGADARRAGAARVAEVRELLGLDGAGNEPPDRAAAAAYARGRALYQAGDLAGADAAFTAALRQDPHALWPHFYHGVCAYRGLRYEDAVLAFTACAALAPGRDQTARYLYNRANALTALGRREQALADYSQALEYDPRLACAALNRALVQQQAGRLREALADLRLAEDLGADPATVCFNRARVQRDAGDREAARASAEEALRHDPTHAEARKLRDSLRAGR